MNQRSDQDAPSTPIHEGRRMDRGWRVAFTSIITLIVAVASFTAGLRAARPDAERVQAVQFQSAGGQTPAR